MPYLFHSKCEGRLDPDQGMDGHRVKLYMPAWQGHKIRMFLYRETIYESFNQPILHLRSSDQELLTRATKTF